MANVFVIHRADIFDKPAVFRKEADADLAIEELSTSEGFPWVKRLCPIHESKSNFDTSRLNVIRERALSKLTEEEQVALGVEDGSWS